MHYLQKMNKKNLILGLAILISSCNQNQLTNNSKQDNIADTESKISSYPLEKLASGFKWAEGPAVDKEGNVYFTDVRQSLILIWTIDNKLDTFQVNSYGTNGLYFDKDNNLLACVMRKRQVTSTSPLGEVKVIASTYKGVQFNEPNGLWSDKKGGVFFTDPKYGKNDKDLSQDGMHVYYISPDRTSITRVIEDFENLMV